MKRTSVNPTSLFRSKQFGFSQAVISESGKLVFISGQVAWDENMKIVGQNDLATQTQKSLDNLGAAIMAAGGNYDNIVMLRIYKVKFKQEDSQIISEILNVYFGNENQPASSFIGVDSLANQEFMIEIEAQAVI